MGESAMRQLKLDFKGNLRVKETLKNRVSNENLNLSEGQTDRLYSQDAENETVRCSAFNQDVERKSDTPPETWSVLGQDSGTS